MLAGSQAQEEAALGGCGHPVGSCWGLLPTERKPSALRQGLRSQPTPSPYIQASRQPAFLCKPREMQPRNLDAGGGGWEGSSSLFIRSVLCIHSAWVQSLGWEHCGTLRHHRLVGNTHTFINDLRARREAHRGRRGGGRLQKRWPLRACRARLLTAEMNDIGPASKDSSEALDQHEPGL